MNRVLCKVSDSFCLGVYEAQGGSGGISGLPEFFFSVRDFAFSVFYLIPGFIYFYLFTIIIILNAYTCFSNAGMELVRQIMFLV